VKGNTAGVATALWPTAKRDRGGLFRSHCRSSEPWTLPVLLPPNPHIPPCANNGVSCSCGSPPMPAIAAMQLPPLSAAAAAAAAAMLQARTTLLRRSAEMAAAWEAPTWSLPGGENMKSSA
jgi:hypothetical protein